MEGVDATRVERTIAATTRAAIDRIAWNILTDCARQNQPFAPRSRSRRDHFLPFFPFFPPFGSSFGASVAAAAISGVFGAFAAWAAASAIEA